MPNDAIRVLQNRKTFVGLVWCMCSLVLSLNLSKNLSLLFVLMGLHKRKRVLSHMRPFIQHTIPELIYLHLRTELFHKDFATPIRTYCSYSHRPNVPPLFTEGEEKFVLLYMYISGQILKETWSIDIIITPCMIWSS